VTAITVNADALFHKCCSQFGPVTQVMPTKPIERLLFAQGGRCFFCQQMLTPGEASIEHLMAKANGGLNGDENTVACCKALNRLLGSMSLKDKLRVILNQNGQFKCPNGKPKPSLPSPLPHRALERVVSDLRKRGLGCPRTLKTLGSSINNLFQNRLSAEQLSSIVHDLQASGIVTVSGTKVSYTLPGVETAS
jgi:hypothetical protein